MDLPWLDGEGSTGWSSSDAFEADPNPETDAYARSNDLAPDITASAAPTPRTTGSIEAGWQTDSQNDNATAYVEPPDEGPPTVAGLGDAALPDTAPLAPLPRRRSLADLMAQRAATEVPSEADTDETPTSTLIEDDELSPRQSSDDDDDEEDDEDREAQDDEAENKSGDDDGEFDRVSPITFSDMSNLYLTDDILPTRRLGADGRDSSDDGKKKRKRFGRN
jgi:hypothetical protein